MRKTRIRTAAVATAAVLTVGVGGAYAWLSVSGEGTGTAATAASELKPIVLRAAVKDLKPNKAGKLTIGYDNPNDITVTGAKIKIKVGDLKGTGCQGNTFEVDNAWPAKEDVFEFEPGTNKTLGDSYVEGATVKWVNDEHATKSCLGQSIPLLLTLVNEDDKKPGGGPGGGYVPKPKP